jgi:hypothetical protein
MKKAINKVYVVYYYFDGEMVMEVFDKKLNAQKFKTKILKIKKQIDGAEISKVILVSKVNNSQSCPQWFKELNGSQK